MISHALPHVLWHLASSIIGSGYAVRCCKLAINKYTAVSRDGMVLAVVHLFVYLTTLHFFARERVLRRSGERGRRLCSVAGAKTSNFYCP